MATNFYYFDDELSSKTVSDFMDYVESSRPRGNFETINKIVIYISTEGGHVDTAYVLADYLINLVERDGFEIELKITMVCNSAGLLFLAYLKNHNNLCNNCIKLSFFKYSGAVLHEISMEYNTRKDAPEIEALNRELKERKEQVLKYFRKYLTKKEINCYNAAGNVTISSDRLAVIFSGSIIDCF